MDCCWPNCEQEKKSENVQAIRRNLEDFLWKVTNVDWIENQEKYTLALFKKFGACSSIEELANLSIDMMAALQKIKLKKENEEDDNKDEVFIELFNVDAPETKEDME